MVQATSGKFSPAFRKVFHEFIVALKKLNRTALSQTSFWLAVREIALATSVEAVDHPTLRTRIELEDDDGYFWLYITCDRETKLNGCQCVTLPAARSSPFRYALLSDSGVASNLPDQTFLNKASLPQIEALLKPLRTAVAEGVVLFVEDEDNVYTLTPNIPSSGRLCAIVSKRLSDHISDADFQSSREVLVETLGQTNFAHYWEDNPILDRTENRRHAAENYFSPLLHCISICFRRGF